MTDTIVTVTGDTEPFAVEPKESTGMASLTLHAPEATEDADWYLHGAENPFRGGTTATVVVDGEAEMVYAGMDDQLDTDELDGEFVVGVVWWEQTDEGEWVERDAVRTVSLGA